MTSIKPFLISCCALALAFATESSVAATYDLTYTATQDINGSITNLLLDGFAAQAQTVPSAVLVPGDTLDVSFNLTQPFTLPAGATPQLQVALPANFLGTNANGQIDYSETIAFSNGGVAVPNSVFTPSTSSTTSLSTLELGGDSSLQQSPALTFDRLDLAVTLLDGKISTVPTGQGQITILENIPSVVPIPGSLYLLVSGLAGLAAMALNRVRLRSGPNSSKAIDTRRPISSSLRDWISMNSI